MRQSLPIILAVVLLSLLLWKFYPRGNTVLPTPIPPQPSEIVESTIAEPRSQKPTVSPPAPNQGEITVPQTQFSLPPAFPTSIVLLPSASEAEYLHKPNSNALDDLSLLHGLLRSHRRIFGTNPVGLNDEITAALTGRNQKGVASLPRSHPAISKQGELLDRWKTPYRFHALSGTQMEIRSAGPDREFFTDDDVELRE